MSQQSALEPRIRVRVRNFAPALFDLGELLPGDDVRLPKLTAERLIDEGYAVLVSDDRITNLMHQ